MKEEANNKFFIVCFVSTRNKLWEEEEEEGYHLGYFISCDEDEDKNERYSSLSHKHILYDISYPSTQIKISLIVLKFVNICKQREKISSRDTI